MPCPYFEPTSPLPWASWRGLLRPPLGAPYDGCCRAGDRFRPSAETLVENCNMGYAAGHCPRFRPGAGDAVRFSVGPATGPVRVVRWLIESGGLPTLFGEADLVEVEAGIAPSEAPDIVVMQLRAYVASFRAAGGFRGSSGSS